MVSMLYQDRGSDFKHETCEKDERSLEILVAFSWVGFMKCGSTTTVDIPVLVDITKLFRRLVVVCIPSYRTSASRF